MTDATEEFSTLIQQGHALVRLENEQQQQIALRKPRDEGKILDRLIDEIKKTPAFARVAYYAIPYKNNEDDPEPSAGQNDTRKWVTGLSIHGAMSIARRWENCATGGRIVSEAPTAVDVEGVMMDYESNVRTMRPLRVSLFYRQRNTKVMKPLLGDRLVKAVQSGISKAIRNAVLNHVPDAIKIPYLDQAMEIAEKGDRRPLAQRIEDLLGGFEDISVSREDLMAYLGKSKVSESDFVRLQGLLNSIVQGYVQRDTIFVPREQKPQQPEQPTVKLNNIL